jgi:trimeric autotransporter adhesin
LAALWGAVSTVPTTTTLTLSPTTGISHGTAENVAVSIAVNPASGTATGDVSLIAKFQNNATQGVQQFTLAANGSVTATTQNLPGGTYSVYAHYAGDGTNAPSDSTATPVIVNKENSETFLIVPLYDSSTGKLLNGNATSVPYGSAYRLRIYVTNSQGVGNPTGVPAHTCDEVNELTCPTGNVTLTGNGTGIDKPGGVYSLDNIGYTRDINPTLTGGSYSLLAQYSGDASYLASSSASSTLTVTPVTTQMSAPFVSSPAQTGTPITINSLVTTTLSSGVAPTGTITFFDGTTPLPGTVTYTSNAGAANGATASLSGIITATFTTVGTHSITAKYSGDANYAAVTSPASTVQIFFPTTLTLTETSTNLVYGQSITVTLKLTSSNKSPAITGTLVLNGAFTQISNVPATASADANGNQILTATAVVVPQYTSELNAQYSGDANYSASTSNSDFIIVVTPDFSVPASTIINVTAGQSGTGTFQVTPASNTPSTVNLTTVGTILGTTITLTPTSVSLKGSPVPVTVTVSSTAPSAASPAALRRQARHSSILSFTRTSWWSTAFLSGLLALYLFGAPGRKRKYRAAFFATLVCLMSFGMGCGGGGGGSGSVGVGGGGPVASTITMTSSNTKLAMGATFTLTANVSSAKLVTGTVTFYQGTTPVAPPIAVVNGQASTIITNNYPPGIYPFTAAYSGDSNNLSSQTGSAINEAFTGLTQVQVMGQTGQIMHQILIQVNLQ